MRKNQRTFRKRAKNHINDRCEVTLSGLANLCDACHIKSYSVCNEEEKCDPNNAIFLLASVHRAFDAGLISFDDDGNLLLSSELDKWELQCLGLHSNIKIRMPGKRRFYMGYHRDNIFKI